MIVSGWGTACKSQAALPAACRRCQLAGCKQQACCSGVPQLTFLVARRQRGRVCKCKGERHEADWVHSMLAVNGQYSAMLCFIRLAALSNGHTQLGGAPMTW